VTRSHERGVSAVASTGAAATLVSLNSSSAGRHATRKYFARVGANSIARRSSSNSPCRSTISGPDAIARQDFKSSLASTRMLTDVPSAPAGQSKRSSRRAAVAALASMT